jgi:3-deoxy-D-manno-octulosonic-acid transferase
MRPYLLNIVYCCVALVAAPWLLYQALTKGKYREGFAAKLLGLVPRRTGDRPCFWLHAVSLGEVKLLAPLLKEIDRRLPDWECVISTTTLTGYQQAKKDYAGRLVCYAPLDFSWAVRAALRRLRPDVLVLVELELWPNLVRAARAAGARVAVVNGRLSERSYRGYRRLRPFLRSLVRQLDLIAAQNEEYAARFRSLGAEPASVRVTGSIKFDGAESDRRNPATRRLARLAGIDEQDIVFLAGSTQEPEEAVALETYCQLCGEFPRLRLVLVPRHPERFEEVARLLDHSGLCWQRRSAFVAAGQVSAAEGNTSVAAGIALRSSPLAGEGPGVRGEPSPNTHHPSSLTPRILLVDAVGELRAWWGTAHIAFVGGSLGQRGGQNMIEPAAYGAAVCFGPNTRNFRDTVSLLLEGQAAVVVSDGTSLTAFVRQCLADREFAAVLGRRAQSLISANLGAARRTVDHLAQLAGCAPSDEPAGSAASPPNWHAGSTATNRARGI